MPDKLLPDTSCLIFLNKIEEIQLLEKLYSKTIITEEIVEEYIDPLPEWIEIKTPDEKRYQKVLEQTVDKGEASLMVLALELKDCVVSIDDLRARKVAKALNLRLTGTLGIIHKAKKAGLISSTKETLQKLKAVDFRISEKIERELLRLSGEYN